MRVLVSWDSQPVIDAAIKKKANNIPSPEHKFTAKINHLDRKWAEKRRKMEIELKKRKNLITVFETLRE